MTRWVKNKKTDRKPAAFLMYLNYLSS